MRFKVLIVAILGMLGLILLAISSFESTYSSLLSLASSIFSLFGSFFGIWYLVSLAFKNIQLTLKEKLVLIIATLSTLLFFALGRYGFMIIFWLPGVLVSIISLRILFSVLHKTSGVVTSSLQDKIRKMEGEVEKRKQQETTSLPKDQTPQQS